MGSTHSGGNAQVLLREEFYNVSCNSVDQVQSSGGRLKKWVWGQRHNPCLSCQCSWASSALTEGINTLKSRCECLCISLRMGKNFLLEPVVSGRKLAWYKPVSHTAGCASWRCFPLPVSNQLAATQRWVCHGHPLVVGAHPLYIWAFVMQFRGFITTHPKPLPFPCGWGVQTKHLLLLQTAYWLHH